MFQNDFIWGSATAAYQVEGAFSQDGKGLSIWDDFTHQLGATTHGTNGDIAADHYNRFKEDVKLMAELGLKSYRFSISWPRIIPNGIGDTNPKGIEFYSLLIDELLKYGIEPMITLYHWDLPLYLQNEFGGWSDRKVSEAFANYAKVCFDNFGDRVKLWTTFNEPVIFLGLGYLIGFHPPKIQDPSIALQACHNVFIANALAVKEFREANIADGKIGIVNVIQPHDAVSNHPEDIKATQFVESCFNHWFYDVPIKGEYPSELLKMTNDYFNLPIVNSEDELLLKTYTVDFMGVNYYKREMVAANNEEDQYAINFTGKEKKYKEFGFKGLFKFVKNPNGIYSAWDWEIYPEGLTDSLIRFNQRYPNFPIYITENGIGTFDECHDNEVIDNDRIDYLSSHIKAAKDAISKGVNLKGYYTWSFIDLLSWLNGYQKRYGFVYIDHNNNLARVKKKSFDWYKNVINTNGSKL